MHDQVFPGVRNCWFNMADRSDVEKIFRMLSELKSIGEMQVQIVESHSRELEEVFKY